MKYKDLNLKKLREDNGLDFAHYTYQEGMCSCCYGPKDLPKRYWKGGIIPDGDEYTYILFKNANNGSGIVHRDDEIKDYQCIEWRLDDTKLDKVCRDLQEQLGDEYVVLVPTDICWTILVRRSNSEYIGRDLQDGHYRVISIDVEE